MNPKEKFILGIESSCDDTAAAIVDAAGQVISSVTVGQLEVHKPYGGVFPELASRAHVVAIFKAVQKALDDAEVCGKDLAAVAVTRGPGLIGPLLVGLNAAAGLGVGWQVPVIGINHLRGHLRSADLDEKRLEFPAMILLVSGGHTLLAYMESVTSVEVLGSTRDDSVGEAYDKVGRLMGLGYPAGAKVDQMAKFGSPSISFPRPMIHQGLEFSFSGLKSAVSKAHHSGYQDNNIAASFVESCMDVLIEKSRRALLSRRAKCLAVVGGVSASPQLRERAADLCLQLGIKLCLPPLRWSTDNAAMIALAGWDYLQLDILTKPVANPNLHITEF